MPLSRLNDFLKRNTVSLRMHMDGVSYWWHRLVPRGLGESGVPTRSVLIICDGDVYCSEQQFALFSRNLGTFRQKSGLVFRHVRWPAAVRHLDTFPRRYQMVWVYISHVFTEAEAAERLEKVAAICKQRNIALVYWDGTDDLSVVWPAVVDLSDLYVKKHVLRQRSGYKRGYRGRSNLTDYALGLSGSDFSTHPRSVAPLNDEQLDKIVVGWNVGLDDKIASLARKITTVPDWNLRPIDVLSRVGNAEPGTFLHALRNPCVHAMKTLDSRIVVSVAENRVSQNEYYAEMLKSKICVSPFGYGEICWREFEAALCGCLVFKPDMSHVETYPNIFQPGVTYVPLAWDYSDLEEKVRFYLDRPAEAAVIAINARSLVLDALRPDSILERMSQVFREGFPMKGHADTNP